MKLKTGRAATVAWRCRPPSLLRFFCVPCGLNSHLLHLATGMSTPAWHLSLLGSVELRGPDAAAADHVLVQPKHVALLAYFAVESTGPRRRRFHRRDHLVALLWPE